MIVIFSLSPPDSLPCNKKTKLDNTNALATIASLRQNNKLVWFDFRDSSGSTQFEVLPFCDLYLKKQLLKDYSQYRQKLYGNHLFTDYIHRQYNISDDYEEKYFPLPPSFDHKLSLSRSPSLLNFRGGTNLSLTSHLLTDKLEKFIPIPHRAAWRSPLTARPIDMLATFNTNYGRRTIA